MSQISGYTFGHPGLATSPVTLADLNALKQTLLFTEEDEKNLRMAGTILADQTDAVLDVWYGYVGSLEQLVSYFAPKGGAPNGEYLSKVRARFAQWILDVCNRPYDQNWLNYQHEVALRHHTAKKNQTDGVDAVPIVHFRYMVALVYPITATMRPFLAKKGHPEAQVEAMHQAWFKAVVLTALLWCHPYIRPNEF